MGHGQEPPILDEVALSRVITRIAHEILERHRDCSELCLVGLHSRGVPLAQRIATQIEEQVKTTIPVGSLDISFHRDDYETVLPNPKTTDIDFDLSAKIVILIDDVIFTGRSIRAALNAINDLGRPSFIQLVELVDRGHRELPIQPDYCGITLETRRGERVQVKLREVDGLDEVRLISEGGP